MDNSTEKTRYLTTRVNPNKTKLISFPETFIDIFTLHRHYMKKKMKKTKNIERFTPDSLDNYVHEHAREHRGGYGDEPGEAFDQPATKLSAKRILNFTGKQRNFVIQRYEIIIE